MQIGSWESSTWVILEATLCLVLDFPGLKFQDSFIEISRPTFHWNTVEPELFLSERTQPAFFHLRMPSKFLIKPKTPSHYLDLKRKIIFQNHHFGGPTINSHGCDPIKAKNIPTTGFPVFPTQTREAKDGNRSLYVEISFPGAAASLQLSSLEYWGNKWTWFLYFFLVIVIVCWKWILRTIMCTINLFIYTQFGVSLYLYSVNTPVFSSFFERATFLLLAAPRCRKAYWRKWQRWHLTCGSWKISRLASNKNKRGNQRNHCFFPQKKPKKTNMVGTGDLMDLVVGWENLL